MSGKRTEGSFAKIPKLAISTASIVPTANNDLSIKLYIRSSFLITVYFNFIPRVNEVEEGGHCITLRRSVRLE